MQAVVHDVTLHNPPSGAAAQARDAAVIINADDWGRDKDVTDRSFECVSQGVLSSVSAMVFTEDSERAASLARQHSVDAGLHLNLTAAFSGTNCDSRLKGHQQKITRFLRASRLCPAIYHPGLSGSFEYVVKAQLDEYERLYGVAPGRVDGHHHMHLCANVQVQKLLPAGTIARRNFSFASGEKGALNRRYRRWQDSRLAKRHRMTDFFFALPPMDPPGRLERIFDLANRCTVEVETHPVNADEYQFLTGGELMRRVGDVKIARGYAL